MGAKQVAQNVADGAGDADVEHHQTVHQVGEQAGVVAGQIEHLAVAVGGAQVKAHQGGKGNDGKGAGARAHNAIVQADAKADGPKKLVEKVNSRPYDVLNSDEARKEAEGNEMSLYHIIRPEINFPVGKDEHDEDVYEMAAKQFALFQEKGWLVKDEKPCYYIYAQTMDGRTQYGIVLGAYVDDYMQGRIKKHELTRKDKEEDRMKHVRVNNANVEPVFFAFEDNTTLQGIIDKYKKTTPEYDFVADIDGFGHTFWVISDDKDIETITKAFREIPYMYIADGHHRSAAAALVGDEKRKQNPNHTGNEEYNYFMAVCFPASHLHIIDYNRVIKDLNGMTPAQFLEKLEDKFVVEDKGTDIYHPNKLHNFSLYLGGHWYSLTAKEGTYDDNDPIGVLDVTFATC